MLQLFKKRKKDPARELRSMLGHFELPSFNASVMKVLGLLRDPGTSTQEIADQIQIDPGMHVKTLSTVNAAAFGLASKISNVQHAVSLLGRSRLETIILCIAVKETLPEMKSEHLDEVRFWTTASERAALAASLAAKLHPSTKAESFISALLQDMAIPVIMHAHQARYSVVLDQWFADRESMLDQIEMKELGYDHATVGALMAERWHLSERVVGAIRGHHGEDDDGSVGAAVKLVSHLGYVDEGKASTVKEKCVSKYAMEEGHLDAMIQQAFKDARNFNS